MMQRSRGHVVAEVKLQNVSKSFGAVRAIRDLSLTIADGEFVVLLGPTGAGKTTVLRLAALRARMQEPSPSAART
jgi:ABC-type sugar transport system ATPase subunit